MDVVIRLTAEEIEDARITGTARNMAKDVEIRSHDSHYHDDGIENNLGTESGKREYSHNIGMLGEIAIGKRMGWSVDRSLSTKGDKADFPGVEVKTRSNTASADRQLLVKCQEYSRKFPKFYVLCWVDVMNPKEVHVIGMISRERFDLLKVRRKVKGNDVWMVLGCELDPFDEEVLREARRQAEEELKVGSSAT